MSAPRLLTHDEVLAIPDPGEAWRASEDRDGDAVVVCDDGADIALVRGMFAGFRGNERNAVTLAAAPNLRDTALDLFAQLAAAHARIADLERLAAGPRAVAVDDGLARPFAPETLHKLEHEPGWDADGREVSR